MNPSPPPFARRLLSTAVGLFALWQLVFLVGANVINLVPRRVPDRDGLAADPIQEIGTFTTVEPLQRAAEVVGDVLDHYSDLSGQEQTWPLFAPGFPPHSTFTAVRVRYADGTTADIRSDFEPADPNRAPVRLPFFNVRRYNVECQFVPAVMQHTPEAVAASPDVVRAQTMAAFRSCQPALLRWLDWRIGEYDRDHPGHGDPVEVTYYARYIPTPLPGGPKVWSEPVRERPLARWYPDRPPTADALPLEVYDVRAGRWVTLLKDGGER